MSASASSSEPMATLYVYPADPPGPDSITYNSLSPSVRYVSELRPGLSNKERSQAFQTLQDFRQSLKSFLSGRASSESHVNGGRRPSHSFPSAAMIVGLLSDWKSPDRPESNGCLITVRDSARMEPVKTLLSKRMESQARDVKSYLSAQEVSG